MLHELPVNLWGKRPLCFNWGLMSRLSYFMGKKKLHKLTGKSVIKHPRLEEIDPVTASSPSDHPLPFPNPKRHLPHGLLAT